MAQQEDEWFSTWFDSPYYHLLYNNRDLQEARLFVDRLLACRCPKPHARILACGQGQDGNYNCVRWRYWEILNPFVCRESGRMIRVLKK